MRRMLIGLKDRKEFETKVSMYLLYFLRRMAHRARGGRQSSIRYRQGRGRSGVAVTFPETIGLWRGLPESDRAVLCDELSMKIWRRGESRRASEPEA